VDLGHWEISKRYSAEISSSRTSFLCKRIPAHSFCFQFLRNGNPLHLECWISQRAWKSSDLRYLREWFRQGKNILEKTRDADLIILGVLPYEMRFYNVLSDQGTSLKIKPKTNVENRNRVTFTNGIAYKKNNLTFDLAGAVEVKVALAFYTGFSANKRTIPLISTTCLIR